MTPTAGMATDRGERTRARILDAALRLFETQGFDATTMRAVARDAGMAVGSSYFYFPSKAHLVQAFYRRTHEEHLLEAAPILARETTLATRLRGVMHAKISGSSGYHHVAASLFATAADPTSPTSPFSPQSAELRREVIDFFAEVVDGSRDRIPRDLRPDLPRLLWTWHMGVLLFWVHDGSPDSASTHALIDQSVELLTGLLGMASLPLMRPTRRRILKLIETITTTPLVGSGPTPSSG